MHIIIDTKEKKPWDFAPYGTTHRALKTGDYSLEGLEDIVSIERKASSSEIAINLVDKRFYRELDRLKEIKHPFIVMECPWSHILEYPIHSTIPKFRWKKLKLSGSFLLMRLTEIQLKYGIHIIACDTREAARRVTLSILKKVYELYPASQQDPKEDN